MVTRWTRIVYATWRSSVGIKPFLLQRFSWLTFSLCSIFKLIEFFFESRNNASNSSYRNKTEEMKSFCRQKSCLWRNAVIKAIVRVQYLITYRKLREISDKISNSVDTAVHVLILVTLVLLGRWQCDNRFMVLHWISKCYAERRKLTLDILKR